MGEYIASIAGGGSGGVAPPGGPPVRAAGGGGAPPPTAPRTTASGGGSVPPRAREAAGRLPVWVDGDRARAVAFTSDESELVDFQSGRDPKAREGVKPPFKYAVVMDHVEARIAGETRAGGSRDVTMVINKEPCGGEAGCDAILPEGARLTVYVGGQLGRAVLQDVQRQRDGGKRMSFRIWWDINNEPLAGSAEAEEFVRDLTRMVAAQGVRSGRLWIGPDGTDKSEAPLQVDFVSDPGLGPIAGLGELEARVDRDPETEGVAVVVWRPGNELASDGTEVSGDLSVSESAYKPLVPIASNLARVSVTTLYAIVASYTATGARPEVEGVEWGPLPTDVTGGDPT
nr:DddA-like double-stranded DNA deaminase toxin [Glycomyces terrestris]